MSAPERNSDSQLSKAFLDDTYRDVLDRFNRMKQQMSSTATVDDGDYDTALKCNSNGYTFEKITTTKIGRNKDDFVEETVIERSLVDGGGIKTTTKHIIKRQDKQGQVEIEVKRADPGQRAATNDADSDYQSRTSTYNNNFDETPIPSTRCEPQAYATQYPEQFSSRQPMYSQQAYEKTYGRRVRYCDVQEDDLSEQHMTTPQNTPTTDFSEGDDDDLMARRLLECSYSCNNCAVYMQENLEACLGADKRQDISCENVEYCLRKHKKRKSHHRKHTRRSTYEEEDNENYLSDPLTPRQASPSAAERFKTDFKQEYGRREDHSGPSRHNLCPRERNEPDNSDYLVTYPSNITNNALETSEPHRRIADKRCPSGVIVAALYSKDCCEKKKYPQATSTPRRSRRHLDRQAAYQSELIDDVSPSNFVSEERTNDSSILRQNPRSYSCELLPPSHMPGSPRQPHNQQAVRSEEIDDISTPYQSVRQSWSDSSLNLKNYNRAQIDDYTNAYVSSTESLRQRNRSRTRQYEMIDDISAPSFLSVTNKSKGSEKSYPSERLTDVSAPSFLDVRSEQSCRQQAYPKECADNILVRIYQNVDQPIRGRQRNATDSPSYSPSHRTSPRPYQNDHRAVGIFYSAEEKSNSGPNERRYPEKLPGGKEANTPDSNEESQESETEEQSNSRSRRPRRDDDKCHCECAARFIEGESRPTTSNGTDNRARVKFTPTVEVSSITPVQSHAPSSQSIPHQYRTPVIARKPQAQRLNEESLARQRLEDTNTRSTSSLSDEDIQHVSEPTFASESSRNETGKSSDHAKESRSSQTDIQNISEPIYESTDEEISEPGIHSTPKATAQTSNKQKSQPGTNENLEDITAPTFSSNKTFQSVSVQTSGDLSCLNDGIAKDQKKSPPAAVEASEEPAVHFHETTEVIPAPTFESEKSVDQTEQTPTPSQEPTSTQTEENIQDISEPTFENDKSVDKTPVITPKGILIHTDENIEDVTEPTLPSDKSADETNKTTDENIQDITEPTLASSTHSSHSLALKYIPTDERVDKSFTSISSNQTAEDIQNITEPTYETLPSSNKDKTEEDIQNITEPTFDSETSDNKTDKTSVQKATSKTEENIKDISAPSFESVDSKVAQSTPKTRPSAEKGYKKTTFEITATKETDEVAVENKRKIKPDSKEENTASAPTTSSDVERLAEIVIPDSFDRELVVILDERAVHETPPHTPERTPHASETKRSIVITYKATSTTLQTSNELTSQLSSELVRRVSKTTKTRFADETPDVARSEKTDKDETPAEITAPSLNESGSWQPSTITPYSATSLELARQARGSEEPKKLDDASLPNVSSWELSNATMRSIHAKESAAKRDQEKKPETEAETPPKRTEIQESTESSDWRVSKASSLSKFSSEVVQQTSGPSYPAKTTSDQPAQQTTEKPGLVSKKPADENLTKTEAQQKASPSGASPKSSQPDNAEKVVTKPGRADQNISKTIIPATGSRSKLTKSSSYSSDVEKKTSPLGTSSKSSQPESMAKATRQPEPEKSTSMTQASRSTPQTSIDLQISSKDLAQGQKSSGAELLAAKSRKETKSSTYSSEVEQKASQPRYSTTTMGTPSTSKRSEEADGKRAEHREQNQSEMDSSDWPPEISTASSKQYPKSSYYSSEATERVSAYGTASSQYDETGKADRPPKPSSSTQRTRSDRRQSPSRSNWRLDSSMIMLIDSSNNVQDISPTDRRSSQAARQQEATRIFSQANTKAENRYDANLNCDQLIELCIPRCFDREIEMAMGANDVLSSASETSSSASFVDCPPIPRCFDQEIPVCYIGAPRRSACFSPSTRCINREQSNRRSRSCERRQSTNICCPDERRRLLRMQQEYLKRCQERE